jgi:uncharacterized membrane protein YjfL (UPF0719 family)
MEEFIPVLTRYGQGLVYCLITFIFILIAKTLADRRTVRFDDDEEIEEKSNLAVGFRRAGLYLGFAVGLAGALGGKSLGFVTDILWLLVDGVLITVCLFICRELNDRVMLAGINNDDAAQAGNVAVGLSECGMYIATGLILGGAFFGESADMATGIVSALVFFVLGQVVLLACGRLYEVMLPFDMEAEIGTGNPAAGLALGGILVALGVILASSVTGPALGWRLDLTSFGLSAVYGIIMLLIFKKLTDWFLLPNADLSEEVERDHNVAALALTEGVVIAMAVIISHVV